MGKVKKFFIMEIYSKVNIKMIYLMEQVYILGKIIPKSIKVNLNKVIDTGMGFFINIYLTKTLINIQKLIKMFIKVNMKKI